MKLTSALLCVVLCVACSGTGPTSPSSTSVVGDGNGRAVLFTNPPLPPNSEFPGTGNNRGAGAPNDCPKDVPVLDVQANAEFVKFIIRANVGGNVRGYIFSIYEADPATGNRFVRTLPMTEGPEGREQQIKGSSLEHGHYYAIGWPVFVGCGKGSESKAFYFSV